MPLHEVPSKRQIARLILVQEIRSLLLSPALWLMLIIVSLLVGYSFIQAVNLFSQASRTALSYPEMASGMNPLEGIFVPTFGAYYLSQTLLLPFVAIRLIGLDKQSGALKLMLQLPLTSFALCGLKLSAMGIIWLISLLPAVLALILWHSLGGYIYPPEIITLLAGHGLYSLAVICIAMFAATISDSLPTAAMFCLAVTLGSWVLDFSASGQSGLLGTIGSLSLTNMLRQFENGLLSMSHVISFISIAMLLFLLTVTWLHPGQGQLLKSGRSLVALLILVLVVSAAQKVPQFMDVTENRRHSFNPADSRALQKLNKPLTITIHLDPQDSRLLDLEHDLLAKLRRSVATMHVKYAQIKSTGLFSASEDDNYGLIEYDYNGHHDKSYSNSQNEILPIIYNLAGLQVTPDAVPVYGGHPLVADAAGSRLWFYIFLPLLFLGGALLARKGKL